MVMIAEAEGITSAPLRRRQVTRDVQQRIQANEDNYWREKVEGYVMQGNFLSLLMEEDVCVSWKSYLWNLPRGVARFAINSGLETLPTGDNLRRWGKRTSDLCRLCSDGSKQTLNHVLSSCKSSLEQGRFTWRHDSILRTIYDFVSGRLGDGFEIFADLQGHGSGNGGTVPPDILVTAQRPDIVVLNRASRQILIFELTCPWDTNVAIRHEQKSRKYSPLINDLVNSGFVADCYCFEVSVRGQLSKANRARLKSFLIKTTGLRRTAAVQLLRNVSKAALLGSFALFTARNEAQWNVTTDLSVNI